MYLVIYLGVMAMMIKRFILLVINKVFLKTNKEILSLTILNLFTNFLIKKHEIRLLHN